MIFGFLRIAVMVFGFLQLLSGVFVVVEFESASRLLNNFGDFCQSQFADIMLSKKCVQE